MRSKITVLGDSDEIAKTLLEGEYAEVVGGAQLPGSDVVVIAGGVDVAAEARRAASRASGAVIVVVDGDVRAALDASLLPRGRVLSVPADQVRAVCEAVLFDRCTDLDVTFVGLEDEVVTVPAVVGAGGVRELRT
jgi:hypothetical protein